ncbi:PetM family of cytochrome b6f complex subunit 7 [Bosea minatitlanensis]
MRFLVRSVGYLLVAAGFIVLVIDGARAIANALLRFTTLGDLLAAIAHDRYLSLGPAVERNLHPLLWDPVLLSALQAPACLVALAFGFALLWLGRAPEPRIGIVTRR